VKLVILHSQMLTSCAQLSYASRYGVSTKPCLGETLRLMVDLDTVVALDLGCSVIPSHHRRFYPCNMVTKIGCHPNHITPLRPRQDVPPRGLTETRR